MKRHKNIANTIIYIILTILSVLWLLPIVWLIIISFRAEPGAWTDYILPKMYTLDNYVRLFTETGLFNYPRWFMNTLTVAIFTCIISTILNLMTSYTLSRLRFKARKPLLNLGLVLGMFPGFMSMIAIYFLLKAMGLAQSLISLVLVYSGGAGLAILLRASSTQFLNHWMRQQCLMEPARIKCSGGLFSPFETNCNITALMAFMVPWVDFIFVSVI